MSKEQRDTEAAIEEIEQSAPYLEEPKDTKKDDNKQQNKETVTEENQTSSKQIQKNAKHVWPTVFVILALVAVGIISYWSRDNMAVSQIEQKDQQIEVLQKAQDDLNSTLELRDSKISALKAEKQILEQQQDQKDDYIALLEDENASISAKTAAETMDDTNWRNFVSKDYHFSIQFPGIPYKSDWITYIAGEEVPTAYYGRSNTDGYYEIQAISFSSESIKKLPDDDSRLYIAMASVVSNDEDVKVIKSELLEDFKGQRALKQTVSFEYEGKEFARRYGLVVFKGNMLYVIDTYSTTEANFEKFLGSFEFEG